MEVQVEVRLIDEKGIKENASLMFRTMTADAEIHIGEIAEKVKECLATDEIKSILDKKVERTDDKIQTRDDKGILRANIGVINPEKAPTCIDRSFVIKKADMKKMMESDYISEAIQAEMEKSIKKYMGKMKGETDETDGKSADGK